MNSSCAYMSYLYMKYDANFTENWQKNMVLAGIWCSQKKPHMQNFMQPIVEELFVLEDVGMLYLQQFLKLLQCT